MTFDLERIERETFVRQIEFHADLPSTNDRAVQLAAQADLKLPCLILCRRQTAGRGRGGNRWWSDDGAVTFSLILENASFTVPAEVPTKVSLSAGVAVCEALRKLLPANSLGLKWPNDVYLEGKKVCGILVEILAPGAERLIVGIGINVNNSLNAAPQEIIANATSVFDVTREKWDLTSILVEVIRNLEIQFQLLRKDGSSPIPQWQEYCLLSGRSVTLDAGSQRIEGICSGIDSEGCLILQTAGGPRHVSSGVIARFE